MRELILTLLPLLLVGCPDGAHPTKDGEPGSKVETKSDDVAAPEKPALETSIFGFGAKTATYKKGKDDAPDTLELGGVDDDVHSPDGKTTVELVKIIESNLFTTDYAVPEGFEGKVDMLGGAATHVWVHWTGGRETEVSLRNPSYSADAATLKFDIEVVGGQLQEGSLGKVEFNLRDCPDTSYICAKSTLTACNKEIGPVGTCWNWLALNCLPCHCDGDMKLCVEKNPKCCGHEDEPCYPSGLGPHGWERYCL